MPLPKEKCILCGKMGTIAARGLCSCCYPKERIKGTLYLYRPKRDKWKDIANDVISLYQGGMTAIQISTMFGISDTGVRHILRRCNVPRRRTGYERKYQLDEFSFDELNPESSYWLGFLYADGHTRQEGSLIVQLSRRDRDHIERLCKFLKSDTKITDKINTGFNVTTEASYVQFNNAYLVRKLRFLGIVTGRNHIKDTIAVLAPNLYSHFIRGYLDGDGSIGITPRVKFCGQRDIMEWISATTSEYLGLQPRKLYPNKSIFQIVYGGRFQAPLVANWIYQGATVYMPRKYIRFQQWAS